MATQFQSLLASAAVVASIAPAFALQKPADPQAVKATYVPRPAPRRRVANANGSLNLVNTLPPGTSATTTSFTNATGLAIPDLATVSQTITVSGAGTYLWDVDLTTFITHTWNSDLDITLTAPNGEVVTITTDNGSSNVNVFNGTLWDDSAASAASNFAYVSGTPAPTLNAEGAFSSLNGIDPAGVWTLTITDDLGGDSGNLSSWKLDITTLNSAPPVVGSPSVFTASPNLAVTDFNTVSSAIVVSGLNPQIAEVRVYTEIPHTWSSDLDVRLTSPAGTTVQLCNLDAGGSIDAFAATHWYDTARTGLLDDAAGNFAYQSGIPASDLVPDGAFARFFGEDPNGTWTLSVYDNASPDSGVFTRWDLSIRTYGPTITPPVSFCTGGTTAHNCVASISGNANPSVSFANPCAISVASVEGQKTGLIFYGIDNTGYTPITWAAGSSSFLCVKAPTQRTGTQGSGGTNNACDGTLALDWNAYVANNPGSMGLPFSAGDEVFLQAWFRDPPSAKTTSLSNALRMTYQP
jgi:subtilisin-like proprotein convertase family protein